MKKIIAILIIVIIVIGIIGVAFLGSTFIFEDSNEDRLIAVITSDKTVSRIGDGFNFSAVRSSGDIKEYSWNFDDGNTSFEPMAAHSYAEAGWYNVTLEIKSKSGNKANTTLAIGVQREDEYIERECGTERDLRLRSGSGRGIYSQIGPNMAQPTINIHFEIYDAIGMFSFDVSVRWQTSENSWHGVSIYYETYTATLENLIIDYIIDPNELPKEIEKYYAEVDAIAWVDEGR